MTDADKEIFSQYDYRCVVCLGPAVSLHHVRPRSTHPQEKDNPDNKVPLCTECHNRVHREGTEKWADILRMKSAQLLNILKVR